MRSGQAQEGRGFAKVFVALFGAAIAVTTWEVTARLIGNPGLVPPIGRVTNAMMVWARSGDLARDVVESVPRAWFALALAVPIGAIIGVAFALSDTARRLFDPVLQFLRSLPPVALLPLFVVWFGIGWWSKLGAALFVCIFPIAVTTAQSASVAQTQYRQLAVDLHLSRFEYIRRILLPAAAPGVVPGIRLASGTAFIMLYVSELAGASLGLGYRISIAQLSYQADLMVAALLVLGLAALATDQAIDILSSRLLHYAGRS